MKRSECTKCTVHKMLGDTHEWPTASSQLLVFGVTGIAGVRGPGVWAKSSGEDSILPWSR